MPTTTEFLEQRLGGGRVVVLDGECVDHVRDYEVVLRELIHGVSSGGLALTLFEGIEGAPRRLSVAVDGGQPHAFAVQGDTDWLDSAAVVAAINHILAERGEPRQLVEYHDEEFGQESGWVLLDPSELAALLEFGLTVNPTVSLCFADGLRLTPVSEDRGGDGTESWEDAILHVDAGPE